MQLQIEMQCDSSVPDESLAMAIKFGVENIGAADTDKYILALLRQLLLHREKMEKNLLGNYLNPAIVQHWQELISYLEEKSRKVVNIQSGSLIFSLLCPTRGTKLQIQDENWKIKIQNKITELLKLLGKHFHSIL